MNSYKILLVDDDVDQLKITYSIIEKHHPENIVYQANSGESAIRLLEKFMPNLIISDWQMSGISGIDLLHLLKENPATKDIPVIIITGVMTDAQDLKIAMEAGAIDYLRKPVVELELLARMNAAIMMLEKHKELIREKDNKIINSIIFTNEVNHFLKKVSNSISEFSNKATIDESLQKKNSKLILEIEKRIKGTGWQHYSKTFNDSHPDFTRKLLKVHPELSPKELELCEMTLLGLSSKELAGLMFIAPESMRVSRSRLRKKLGLKKEQNLHTYLNTI